MKPSHKRDLFCGVIGAVVGAVCLTAWCEYSSGDFTLVCQGIEMELRKCQDADKVPILYCVRDIPAGTVITIDTVVRRTIDMGHCPTNAISDEWIAVGRVSGCNIKKGEVLSLDEFGLAPNKRSAQIPK